MLPADIVGSARESSPLVTKSCKVCNQTKSVDEFYPDKRARDGLAYRCALCARGKTRAEAANCGPPTTKLCSRCKQTQSVFEFYRNGKRRDGLMTVCVRCLTGMTRQWRVDCNTRMVELVVDTGRASRASRRNARRDMSRDAFSADRFALCKTCTKVKPYKEFPFENQNVLPKGSCLECLNVDRLLVGGTCVCGTEVACHCNQLVVMDGPGARQRTLSAEQESFFQDDCPVCCLHQHAEHSEPDDTPQSPENSIAHEVYAELDPSCASEEGCPVCCAQQPAGHANPDDAAPLAEISTAPEGAEAESKACSVNADSGTASEIAKRICASTDWKLEFTTGNLITKSEAFLRAGRCVLIAAGERSGQFGVTCCACSSLRCVRAVYTIASDGTYLGACQTKALTAHQYAGS